MKAIQAAIQTLIDRLCAEGRERGIQVAAYHRGRLVVNACAGIADVNTGARVQADTLFPVFSTTKGLVATVVHLLVERGAFTYETPVAAVWPEFGVNGKETITIAQVMRHTSGIPRLPAGTPAEAIGDWDGMCRLIAGLIPESKPGSQCVYHALTYGWILGEVARRADGRAFPQLLQEEICAPLGISTMFVSLPEELDARVARLEAPEVEALVDDGTPQVVPFALQPLYSWMNRADGRRACVPAGNGIMNALAIARHYAALLPGGVDGVELLPTARVTVAAALAEPPVACEGHPLGWALGYLTGEPGSVMNESPATFGQGGYGGSMGFADRERHLSFGLTRNLFRSEDPAHEIADEVRRILDSGDFS